MSEIIAPRPVDAGRTRKESALGDQEQTYGWAFWIGLILGWLVIAIGVNIFFNDRVANAPGYSLVYALASNIIHDAVFAPVVCVVAWLGHRFLPRALQAPAAWSFFASIAVLLVAAVPLYRNDDNGYNPTILPINYRTSTLTVIAVVWAIGALWAALSLLRRRRPRRATE